MKSNQKYSMVNNILYIIHKSWRNCKKAIILTALMVPFSVILPLLTTLLLTKTVEYATEGASTLQAIIMIFSIMLCILISTLVLRITNSYLSKYSLINRTKMGLEIKESVSRTDYINLENSEYNKMRNNAQQAIGNNSSIAESIFNKLGLFGINIIGLITYSTLIFSLSPLIVIVLLITTVLLYFVGRINADWIQKNKVNWYEIDRKKGYILSSVGSFRNAKDIKLYGISSWFSSLYDTLLGKRMSWGRKYEKRAGSVDFLNALVTFIRDAVAYGFLIYKIAQGNLSASEFVFYFSLIGQYSLYILGIIDGYIDLYRSTLCISDVRDFLNYKSVMNHGEGAEIFDSAPEIEFQNVSFAFSNSDLPVLKNLSFTIHAGEKIALVGANGAGKTTLVKLICGLFLPSDGRILVDGKEITQYNIEKYYSKIAAVFQDIFTLPMSIEENIAGFHSKIDTKKLNTAISDSGLDDKIKTLPNGAKTKLDKTLFPDATDLSGGERQKLAIARAIYKKAPVVILDEPTAALDPIAEMNIYNTYNSFSQNATSIFVSHRLASTRFCDKIFFMENGEIIEVGNHDTLMEKGGKYAEMFEIQSHYYKNDFAPEGIK